MISGKVTALVATGSVVAAALAAIAPNDGWIGPASAAAQSCPTDGGSSGGSSSARGSRRGSRAGRQAADIAVGILEAIFAGAARSSDEEAAPAAAPSDEGGFGPSIRWPDGLGARLDGAFGSMDLADADFASQAVLTTGSALRLSRTELAGGEIAFDVVPTRHLRLTVGAGLYWPVGQMESFDHAELGRGGEVESLVVLKPFAELGVALRGSVFDPFLVAHAGWLWAQADVRGECGCSHSFEASRFVVGPRAGLRAYLVGPLFVEASLLMDLVRFPDWVGAMGFGLGPRSS